MGEVTHIFRSMLFASGFSRILSPLLLIFLSACGGGVGSDSQHNPTGPDPVVLESLVVVPATTQLAKGLSLSYGAVGYLSNGSLIDLTTSATWGSDNESVASVDAQGLVTSHTPGITTIYVSLSGLRAEASLEVTDAALLTIEIQPPSAKVAKGLTADFTAFGRYSDGTRRDITAEAVWSAANTSLLELAGASPGRATALATGTTEVTVSLTGVSATAAFTVTDASLVDLSLSPIQPSLAAGTGLALTATGLYSDNTWADVSRQVQWQSSDSHLVTVDTTGQMSGVAEGAATVTASLGGLSDTARVTVTAASLVSLDLAPVSATVGEGRRVALVATGVFSDGSVQNVSNAVQWGSSDSQVAAVITDSTGASFAEGRTAGSAVLTGQFNGLSSDTVLTVTPKVLTSVFVTPQNPVLVLGTSTTLKAIGSYDDGSSQALDDEVVWEAADPSIVTVDALGKVTTLGVGNTRITGRIDNIVGSVEITVADATLESIEVSSACDFVAAGLSTSATAIGHYSDGSSQSLTDQVYWSSSAPSVADISADGHLQALTAGITTIMARHGDVTGQVSFTVTDALLTGLAISPQLPTVVSGGHLQLSAMGTYSDGRQQDLTGQVLWSSADQSLAAVSTAADSGGEVTGIAPGSVMVSASLAGISDDTTLTVLQDPQAPVALSIVAAPNVVLSNGVDSTTLTVQVKAADAGAVVPDGTVVTFSLISGQAQFSSTSALTTAGMASVELTADQHGAIVVQAAVADRGITNVVALTAVDSFADVMRVIKLALGDLSNPIAPKGTLLGLIVANDSNRDFNLDRFNFIHDGAVIIDSDDPQRLNGNSLSGGELIVIVVELGSDFTFQSFASRLLLSDPVSGQEFTVGGDFPGIN